MSATSSRYGPGADAAGVSHARASLVTERAAGDTSTSAPTPPVGATNLHVGSEAAAASTAPICTVTVVPPSSGPERLSTPLTGSAAENAASAASPAPLPPLPPLLAEAKAKYVNDSAADVSS